MNFEHSDKVQALLARRQAFMEQHLYPNERAHDDWVHDPARLWQYWPGLDTLKAQARPSRKWRRLTPPTLKPAFCRMATTM